MESENPDLSTALESAKAHLEMYRRSSQEELNDPNKEMLLTRSRDQEKEDISGPLFDQGKEMTASDVKPNPKLENQESTKEGKTLSLEGEEDEDDESSNKNFDSSTITLGDQQSFQNQAELTSQTTYTNIHEMTGPAKDEVVQLNEAPELPDVPSHGSNMLENTASIETAGADSTPSDDVKNTEENQHNQVSFNPVDSIKEKKRSRSFFKRLFNIKRPSRNV